MNCKHALASLHFVLKSSYAFCVSLCFFPILFLHFLYLLLASLHYSLYQGAKCFAHRFGLAAMRFFFCLTTPNVNAASIKNYSTFADLRSLSCLYCSLIFVNASAKSYDAVCSFHLCVLSMYLSNSISPIHSIVSPYCACVVDVAGWFAGLASRWSAVTPGVVVGGGVACVCCVVVVVIELSHIIEEEEEEK